MRMAATPLHPEALAPTLAKADKSWTTRTYPILYRDPDGVWQSAWPDRFSLEAILRAKLAFEELGEGETYRQEFMCEAVDPGSQTFTQDMFVVEPRARSYHAVYAIYDPARTTNVKSATTGKAVASWIGQSSRRLGSEQRRSGCPTRSSLTYFKPPTAIRLSLSELRRTDSTSGYCSQYGPEWSRKGELFHCGLYELQRASSTLLGDYNPILPVTQLFLQTTCRSCNSNCLVSLQDTSTLLTPLPICST